MEKQEETSARSAACSRCFHSAESHMHGNLLSCAVCALGPLAHAMGIGCSLYTLRTVAHSGASCREPGCECAGYCGSRPPGGQAGGSAQELLGGGDRQ